MNNKRLLSLLLSLVILLMTCMPMPVFAEGEMVEEIAVEEIAEEPVEEIIEDPTVEPTEEPAEDPTAEPTEEPAEEPVVEPEFVPGYVAYDADTEIYESDRLNGEPVVLAEDGVVYAYEEADEGVYGVYYVVEADEIEIGYIDGEGDSLTEEEIEAYIKTIEKNEEAVTAEIPGVEDGILAAVELVVEEIIPEEEIVADPIPVEDEEQATEPSTQIEGIQITKQPANQTVAAGAEAVFTVEATGTELTYQWQAKSATASGWNSSSGNNGSGKTASLSLTAKNWQDGYMFRCKITDDSGNVAYTETATLTIGVPAAAIEITKQPANQTVPAGTEAVFTVEATGTELTYQWQAKSATASGWNSSSGNNGSGKTASLSLTAKNWQDGYMFRCQITDGSGNVAYSETATLTIGVPAAAIEITKQPANQTVAAGAEAVFTVEATGTELTYQWQVETGAEATEWTDIAEATAATYEVVAAEEMNGYVYRVVVTSAQGLSITSEEATLTVNAAVTEIVADEVTYTITGETTVEVKSYAGSEASVTVPETVEGYTVTAIGESAFEGNTALVSIDLPNTIEVIGKRAFANCTSLTTMN